MSALRSCTIAQIIDAKDGDILATVAIAHQRDAQRLLDLVVEAAKRSEGWGHTTASRLLSVSVGDSVIAVPAPLVTGTGEMVWRECRGAFFDDEETTGATVYAFPQTGPEAA